MWWAVFCREHLSAGFFTKARRDKHLHILHVHILHLFTPYICAPSLSLCLSLSLSLSLSLPLSLSPCLFLSLSLPLSLSLSLSPSLPLSLSPSLPLSLSPSLPRSLSPSLPRSLAPSLPLSFSPSLACMGSGGALAPWHFVWQAWGLVTSTSLACGRRGTWWHRPHFRWRAHGTLCGRRGTWWHRRSLTTLLYGRRGTTWSRLAPWSRGGVFGGHRRPGTPVAPCIIIIIIIISIIILERERTEGRKREKFLHLFRCYTHTHTSPPHAALSHTAFYTHLCRLTLAHNSFTHNTFRIQLLTTIVPPPSPCLFHHPVQLQPLRAIFGRSWLVGFSGPLILRFFWAGAALQTNEHPHRNCGQIAPKRNLKRKVMRLRKHITRFYIGLGWAWAGRPLSNICFCSAGAPCRFWWEVGLLPRQARRCRSHRRGRQLRGIREELSGPMSQRAPAHLSHVFSRKLLRMVFPKELLPNSTFHVIYTKSPPSFHIHQPHLRHIHHLHQLHHTCVQRLHLSSQTCTMFFTREFLHRSCSTGAGIIQETTGVFTEEFLHRSSFTGVLTQEFLHRSCSTEVVIQEFLHRS